jgi:hypothetical protein
MSGVNPQKLYDQMVFAEKAEDRRAARDATGEQMTKPLDDFSFKYTSPLDDLGFINKTPRDRLGRENYAFKRSDGTTSVGAEKHFADQATMNKYFAGNEWWRHTFADGYKKIFKDDGNHWSHSLLTWLKSDFCLQRTETSRAQSLRSFVDAFRPACGWINGVPITPKSQMWKKSGESTRVDLGWPDTQIFLMQHDWAGAFAGDSEFDNKASECRPPAPNCFIEYTISSRHVIAVIPRTDEHDPVDLAIAVPNGWFIQGRNSRGSTFEIFGPGAEAAWDGHRRLLQFVGRQFKAACIALDAEVAETEIVRTPEKLNAARERRGQSRLPDYHVLNLANRKRYAPLPPDLVSGEKRNSPRLHFRRGHDRHYANYKVWIKWQLVGNPDLGFIDKHYRL